MAHLTWHGKIVRTWKLRLDTEISLLGNVPSYSQYHLTETGWLLKTTGKRLGGAKVIAKPSETEKKEKYFHMLSNEKVWESVLK